jgi:dihydrofolate reductase
MKKVILYIAASLDGYIAKPDHSLDWLEEIVPAEPSKYDYEVFLEQISTLIMGRKTHDVILKISPEWPYTGLDCYVVSKQKDLSLSSPNTSQISENLPAFLAKLKENSQKDIWLVGGGELAASFIAQNLLDRIILYVVPVLLGEGIPLFPTDFSLASKWKLNDCQSRSNGMAVLVYDRK